MARSSHLFGELEVELVKPYPDTMWGVMPGILDGEIVVHALNPNGIAKEKLHAGDQLVSIDGVEPQDEEHVVELLNAAHDAVRKALMAPMYQPGDRTLHAPSIMCLYAGVRRSPCF